MVLVRQQQGFHSKQDEILHFMQRKGWRIYWEHFPSSLYEWDSLVPFFFRAAMFFGFHGMNVAI